MLRALFARLTEDRVRGSALFERVVAEARRPHWYVEGEVPDTVDGRFAMVATVTALVLVRLERSGDALRSESAALTERLVDSLDSELREMGVGDPALGKQVLKLVGALELRVKLLQSAIGFAEGWRPAVLRAVFRDRPPSNDALRHCEEALQDLWRSLESADDGSLAAGAWQ